jgi:hypothetical protein
VNQTYQAPFCAICVSDDGPLHWEPLGKDGANVAVCESCACETPRAYSSARGYEVNENGMSQAQMRSNILRTEREIGPQDEQYRRLNFGTARRKTRGWILVRLPVQRDGNHRDHHEAVLDIVNVEVRKQLRIVGTQGDGRGELWLLYERPDPSSKTKLCDSVNPLAWLEQFRTETA